MMSNISDKLEPKITKRNKMEKLEKNNDRWIIYYYYNFQDTEPSLCCDSAIGDSFDDVKRHFNTRIITPELYRIEIKKVES